MATVVVPFRAGSAKRRLELPEDVRTEFAHAMLVDVLEAATAVGPTVLVTEGEAVRAREIAEELGVFVVDDPGRGQAEAVLAGLTAIDEGPVLIVNADLPALRPRDLLALLGAMPPDGIAIAAARDGTTNALALSRPALFAPLYGPGSAARFRQHAEALGAPVVEPFIPALAADVDTVAQLTHLAS